MSRAIDDKRDYKPLVGRSAKEPGKPLEVKTLRSPRAKRFDRSLTSSRRVSAHAVPSPAIPGPRESAESPVGVEEVSRPSETLTKKERKSQTYRDLLTNDRWLVRNGHGLTFALLYLFAIVTLFRPYDISANLSFTLPFAFYFALATLAIYIPSQLAIEGNLTTLSTEIKAVLAMVLISIVTMPIARDPALAWAAFNDTFIKAIVIFVVMVNVLRTRKRLMATMWLSLGAAIYLSGAALNMYRLGILTVEEYRVSVETNGMFGNPNEMALHLVMMTPLIISLGLAAKGAMRWFCFGLAGLFVGATMVTFSRGGFLGLIVCMAFFAWKVGRKYRLNVTIASVVVGGLALILAPGNYGLRMLSIVVPGLDTFGSSDHRQTLLKNSIWASLRNPQGIGIGNSPLFGANNLQTHNAFTQVSSELGVLGLLAYLIFMLSPFRKLIAIERTMFDADTLGWFYYLSIGLQASIVGYLVSSFFASVAYNWFIYFLIAYAVAFRRVYAMETGAKEKVPNAMGLQPLNAT